MKLDAEGVIEMSLNKILLIGNMLNDPEIRYTAAGKPVASFRVETTRGFLAEGEVRQGSEIFSIAAFGRLAEVAAEFLAKSWHHRTEVVAENIRLICKHPEVAAEGMQRDH